MVHHPAMGGARVEPEQARARLAPDAPLTVLKGVGPALQLKLRAQGLVTVRDLLLCFPRRHQEVLELAVPHRSGLGRLVRLVGRAERASLQWLPGRRSMVVVTFAAKDGTLFTAPFFNQPYLRKAWPPGTERVIEGVLDQRRGAYVLTQPRVLAPDPAHCGPVLVHYPELVGVSESRLRAWIAHLLERVDPTEVAAEILPRGLRERLALQAIGPALVAMHRPTSVAEHERARQRFAVHEAVALFRRVELARRRRLNKRGPHFVVDAELAARIAARIPFALTGDQARAVAAITVGLAGPAPLGVLLQGDVGTGKTAVALWAALAAIAHGWQVAFLAPTELLAEQQGAVARAWLAGSAVTITTLVAGLDDAQSVRAGLALGTPQIVFGTHALLTNTTTFGKLGLVIIDEQHRFGVAQRAELVLKGFDPHVLVMTATPIPRTLALALFGDLDTLILRERPPGHRPLVTLHRQARDWPRVVATIASHVRRGELVYVVCPQIGANGEKGGAVRVHATLSKRLECGIVHGEQRPHERAAALTAFRSGSVPVLVGTTVLEVGVDVRDATLMVVINADRFGLATLHQLRGRVGRGIRRGLCLLLGERNARVDAVCKSADGFALAEVDLHLRGAGELLGTRQSGAHDLRALDPVGDRDRLATVRDAVRGEA